MNKPKYKIGDTVNIYHDPCTKQIFEGTAKLIKLLSDDFEFQTWQVRFKGEKQLYIRRIWIK